jgi:hypothetical protein
MIYGGMNNVGQFGQDPDEKDKDQTTFQSPTAGKIGSGGVASTNTQTVAPKAGNKQGSGSWTNLNSYLDANRPQAETLANKILNPVTQKQGEVKTGVTNLQSEFNVQEEKDRPASTTGVAALANTPSFEAFASNPNEDIFGAAGGVNTSAGTYAPPKLEKYEPLAIKGLELQNTEKGISDLSKYYTTEQGQQFGVSQAQKQTATGGETNLNQLLVGGGAQGNANVGQRALGIIAGIDAGGETRGILDYVNPSSANYSKDVATAYSNLNKILSEGQAAINAETGTSNTGFTNAVTAAISAVPPVATTTGYYNVPPTYNQYTGAVISPGYTIPYTTTDMNDYVNRYYPAVTAAMNSASTTYRNSPEYKRLIARREALSRLGGSANRSLSLTGAY